MSAIDLQFALYLAPGIPLVGFLFIALLGRWPDAREGATLLAGLALVGVVAALFAGAKTGDLPAMPLLSLAPGLDLYLRAEPLGLLFALAASLLWLINSLFSIGYMRAKNETHQTRFYLCFAIAISATMGIALAGNLLTFFIAYEALTLSTYPLVTHSGTQEARKGGRVYVSLLLGTSIGFLLVAIIWTYVATGRGDFVAGGILAGEVDPGLAGLLLLLYAFGVGKAALMPFHRWLPAAMVAPTPVSAFLHAVAVVKAGVFAILKISTQIFGLEFLASLALRPLVLYVAAFTVIAASLIALFKTNLKARLAYSTVAQLSYVVMGAMLATPAGILGGALQLVTHAMAKITLFMCAGAIYVTSGANDVRRMKGLGRRMPLTFAAFTLASFSLIGLPPFGGSLSKWQLLLAAGESGAWAIMAVLLFSSLLSAAYLLPICAASFFAKEEDETPEKSQAGAKTRKEAPLACLVPLCLTALGCLLLFFFAGNIRAFLSPLLMHGDAP
jgi:multicomponent Na+:H+ antiporter subunit D